MKTIRNQQQLRKHLESLRRDGENDGEMAIRLGIHFNTMTKLKHGINFEPSKGLRSLGLTAVYEVKK